MRGSEVCFIRVTQVVLFVSVLELLSVAIHLERYAVGYQATLHLRLGLLRYIVSSHVLGRVRT